MAEDIELDVNIELNLGNLIRNSALLVFVIQILSIIFMIGSVGAILIASILPALSIEMEILLFLFTSALVILGFLLATGVFIRFSRRITKNIVKKGIGNLDLDSKKVKTFLYLYGMMVTFLGITGLYGWYLVESYYIIPWAVTLPAYAVIPFQFFGFSLGGLVIASILLLVIIVEGRLANKVFKEGTN